MKDKLLRYLVPMGTLATVLSAGVRGAYAQLSTTTAVTISNSFVEYVSTVLEGVLDNAFLLIAVLIGVFFVVRLIRKWIGRPRG
jgi:hypothetical protein